MGNEKNDGVLGQISMAYPDYTFQTLLDGDEAIFVNNFIVNEKNKPGNIDWMLSKMTRPIIVHGSFHVDLKMESYQAIKFLAVVDLTECYDIKFHWKSLYDDFHWKEIYNDGSYPEHDKIISNMLVSGLPSNGSGGKVKMDAYVELKHAYKLHRRGVEFTGFVWCEDPDDPKTEEIMNEEPIPGVKLFTNGHECVVWCEDSDDSKTGETADEEPILEVKLSANGHECKYPMLTVDQYDQYLHRHRD